MKGIGGQSISSKNFVADMLRKILKNIELLSKAITMISPVGLVLGAAIVAIYLFKMGMSKEIVPTLTSPTLLILLALCGIVFLAVVVFYSFVPSTVFLLFSSGINLKSYRSREEFMVHFSIFFLPPISLLAMAMQDYSHQCVTVGLLCQYVMLTLLSIIAYRESWSKTSAGVGFVGSLAFAIFGVQLVLVFVVLMITPLVTYFYGDGGFSILAFVILFFGYSFFSGIVTTGKSEAKIAPLLAFGAAIFVAYIFASAPNKFAKFLGLGCFDTTIAIDSAAFAILDQSGEFDLKPINDNTYLARNVFVLLQLPDKLIVAPKSAEGASELKVTNSFTIRSGSVIGAVDPIKSKAK